jgi:sigma-E factor negative regulatory protein RseA
MNTKEIKQESISLLADGELTGEQLNRALSDLCLSEAGRSTWDVYHQIGDILRDDELALPLSPDFAARMKARLDAEPSLALPVEPVATASSLIRISWLQAIRQRFLIPGMTAVAAAIATLAFMSAPQLVALRGASPGTDSAIALNKRVTEGASARAFSSQTVAHDPVLARADTAMGNAPAAGGAMLRDPRIDDYLIAHQRFSPSVYSTAQYARSAMFATDPEK